MMLNSVVLPAPLGPISPKISPSSTVNDTSSKARSPPKRRDTRSQTSTPPSPQEGREDTARQVDRHQDEDRAVQQQAVLAQKAQRLRQDREDDASDDRPQERGRPAEDRIGQDVDRLSEAGLRGVDDVREVDREPSG